VPDHYYEVGTKSEEQFYCKGEPFEKDGFLIFTQWPDKKEWRLKKELVIWVKDTGTLSPEEIEQKEALLKQERVKKLKALFPISDKTHNPHFVPKTLAEARKIANDEEIKDALTEGSFKFKRALEADYSLDEIAQYFKDKEDGKDVDPKGDKSVGFDPSRPYEVISPNKNQASQEGLQQSTN